tara:strand:+ start:18808 stop:19173 length:366 start_codon:yes stop_codon:yes gene_type:complete
VFKAVYRYSLAILVCIFALNLPASQTFTLEDGEVLKDPTKPDLWNVPQAVGQGSKEPAFELNYIVMSAGQKRAMIDGKKVLEGDFVSGAKVTRITQDSVHLFYKGQHKELRINKVNGIQRN